MLKALLNLLIFLPVVGVGVVSVLPTKESRIFTFFILCASFITSLWVLFLFKIQPEACLVQGFGVLPLLTSLNIELVLGVDGVSVFFIVLTHLLLVLCFIMSWADSLDKRFMYCFLGLNFLLTGVFLALDVLLFYIFFESILIPMFILIGIWGSRERKVRAAYMLFFYTLVTSVIMLIAILFLYTEYGSTNYFYLAAVGIDESWQKFLWIAFFLSFASKIPMVPFHIWLPEAHVEAPTFGSVLLAGILLKMGVYGFIRFSLGLFPYASLYYTPFIHFLALIGVIYTSLTAMRQVDLKKVIAYASISHMNLVVLGIFSYNSPGMEGAIFQSISHGFVSSALFFLIGVVYERYHSRMIAYYSGLVTVMPLFAVFFVFFTMANISLPPTSSFVGEFLILLGLYKYNTVVALLGSTGMVLGGCYSLWLLNRIVFGNINLTFVEGFKDLYYREFFVLIVLAILTIFVGVYPSVISSYFSASLFSF